MFAEVFPSGRLSSGSLLLGVSVKVSVTATHACTLTMKNCKDLQISILLRYCFNDGNYH